MYFGHQARLFSESLINHVSESMSAARCAGGAADECRDDAAALRLKLAAIVAILFAGVAGVALPLVGRKRRFLRTDGNLFVFAKAFAAGVILATGFVHMLHDAESALTNPCLPKSPWRRFPFSGFVAMVAALGTLMADFVATQFYERKHREEERGAKEASSALVAASAADEEDDDEAALGITIVPVGSLPDGGEAKDAMHIVGMHAHAAAHRHSHPQEHGACEGHRGDRRGHGHAHDEGSEVSSHVRHIVVSQVRG